MARTYSSWFFFVSFFILATPTYAQTILSKEKTKVLLNAQFIERDNEKDITILRDNVQVILEQNFITCHEAIILWAKNEIVAVGNVTLKTPKSDIKADKIIFNFKEFVFSLNSNDNFCKSFICSFEIFKSFLTSTYFFLL